MEADNRFLKGNFFPEIQANH